MKKNTKVSSIKTIENSKLTKEQMHKTAGGWGTSLANYYDDDWCGNGRIPPFPWPPRQNFVIYY